jgi:hypothetical protein
MRGREFMAVVAVLVSAVAGVFALAGPAGATRAADDVQADIFQLLNTATDQCADLPVKVVNGTQVVQEPCRGQATQVWRADQVPTSFNFRIVNQTNGLCMDLLPAGNVGDQIPVVLAQCSAKLSSQEWEQVFAGGAPGRFRFVNQLFGQCLEVKDGSLAQGAPLQVSKCDDAAAHQVWFKVQVRPGA